MILGHASEGFSLEFVEGESTIAARTTSSVKATMEDTCNTWTSWNAVYSQDDSGI